jgi:hypothetical protein
VCSQTGRGIALSEAPAVVKKSSFIDKLVSRFRSSSGVRVDAGHRRRGRSETVEARAAETLEPEPGQVPARPGAEARSSRKISSREDAVITMNESFGELSSLLRGVQVRLEDQGGQMAKVGEHTQNLPATNDAQLEVLKSLATHVERQNQLQEGMVRAFTDLPTVMDGLKSALERVTASDKRTVETLVDFRHTMDRIQDGMGTMVESAKAQADASKVLAKDQKATAENMVERLNEERKEQTEVQKAVVRQLENSTQEGLRALRWAQEDQANRMVKLVGEAGKLNRVIVVMLIMSFAALASILVAILTS